MGVSSSLDGTTKDDEVALRPPVVWQSRLASFEFSDELLLQPVPESFLFALEDSLEEAKQVASIMCVG